MCLRPFQSLCGEPLFTGTRMICCSNLSSSPALHQSPSSAPPPPPPLSSNIFLSSRFSSEKVSHYLSEIKTTVPRIPHNLRALKRGVSLEVVCWCVDWLFWVFPRCLQILKCVYKYIDMIFFNFCQFFLFFIFIATIFL